MTYQLTRIANAFKSPAALTDDDHAFLVALMTADARKGCQRARKRQKAGGATSAQIAAAARRTDLRKLQTAWD